MSAGQPPPLPSPSQPPQRPVTMLESVEELRAMVRAGATVREAVPSSTGSPSVLAPPATADDTQPFRPSQRPPMGLLHVFDDGDTEGEVVRVRCSPFVIGRVEGDLVIPHD